MRIYIVRADVSKFQIILPVSSSDEVIDSLTFDGRSKIDIWRTSEFYIDNPLAKKGDFASFLTSGAFACNEKAVDKFLSFWQICGELLPIQLEGALNMFILNVTDCINVLDQNQSKFDFYEDGTRSNRILKYAFHKNRFHESSIFKIPETAKSQILTYTGIKDPDEEFYYAYKKSGLTGLSFEEIYSDE